MELKKLVEYKHVYFIGIGGIGMSALARFFYSIGKAVSGYDLRQTALTDELTAEGMKIHYEEDVQLIPFDVDLVIYTPAIPSDHLELNHLLDSDLPVIKRSEALGLLSKSMKCIAVAGTHGKTSTSSIVAHLMTDAGLSPTAFIGGIMRNYDTNYLQGDSDWFIAEADEYDRSFLQLTPTIAIVQSLDADHLDIYGSHEEMLRTYEQFTLQIVDGGILIMQSGLSSYFSEDWSKTLSNKNIQLFEIGPEEQVRYDQVSVWSHRYHFDFVFNELLIDELVCRMPGLHNVKNATAAILACLKAGVSADQIKHGMDAFGGIKRRFEWVFETENFTLIDDYAHHPTELKAAIDTARKLYPEAQISAIFQPHLYSRTQDFFEDFALELDKLDQIFLLPIYPAREQPIPGVSSQMIFDIMKNNNRYLVGFQDLIGNLQANKPEILLTLGASDLNKFHKQIIGVLT